MSLDDVVASAFREAMPRGDLAARRLSADDEPLVTRLIARQDLRLAAREIFEIAVRLFSPSAVFHWQFANGAPVLDGQTVGWVKAPPRATLTAGPVALDLLARACGVATLTAAYHDQVAATDAQITGAPRATPGLRALETLAITTGGGVDLAHTFSEVAYVGVNFARAAGSMEKALEVVGNAAPVHAECANLDDVRTAVTRRVAKIILTDAVDAAAARPLVPAFIPVEAGGAVTLARAAALARAGVDFVRVDALNHAGLARGFELVTNTK